MGLGRLRTHRAILRWAAASAIVLAAACASHDASARDGDSAMLRDLALAQTQRGADASFQDTVLAQATSPAVQDPSSGGQKHAAAPARKPAPPETPRDRQPVATAPAASPAPSPVAQAPAAGPAIVQQAAHPAAANRVAPGTSLQLVSGARVCTTSSRVGDHIVATLQQPVMGANGILIPAGSAVNLEVAMLTPTQSSSVGGQIKFRVISVVVGSKTYGVNGDVYTLGGLERSPIPNSDPNAGKKKVIAGAVAGGILGQILGHNTKGTVIGVAAGAAAGAAAAQAGEDYEDCLPNNSPIELTLSSALLIV